MDKLENSALHYNEHFFEFDIRYIDDESVELSYTIKNEGTNPIYLMTPLYDPVNCDYKPNPNQLYSFWHSPFVLHFTKRVWPASVYNIPNSFILPFLTLLKPDGVFQETIQFKAPLNIQYPYIIQDNLKFIQEGYDVDRYVAQSRAATFSMGYVEVSERDSFIQPVYEEDINLKIPSLDELSGDMGKAMQFLEETIEMQENQLSSYEAEKTPVDNLYTCDYEWLIQNQKYLRSEPLPIEIIAIKE